jgi:hypothetical protein
MGVKEEKKVQLLLHFRSSKKKKKKTFSYLHRLPEVVPSPLPVEDVLVDLARRQVVLLLEGQVEEALVVAEVEVDL